MKKILKISLFSWVTIFFINCSSYAITYNTNPPGASIVCNGRHEGYAPVTLYYENLKETPYTQPCEAVWVSGAREEFRTYWGDVVDQFPYGVETTVQRPDYVPGLEKDMQFAFEIEQSNNKNSSSSNSDPLYYLRHFQQQQNHNEIMNYLRYGY